MIKTIIIDGKEWTFAANAGTAYRYQQCFHKDFRIQFYTIFQDGNMASADSFAEKIDLVQQLAYIMYKQAAKEIDDISYEDYINWLDNFDALSLSNVGADIINLYQGQQTTAVKPKKKRGQQTES